MSIASPADQPAPAPCPDCGRSDLTRESVVVGVEGRPEPVWTGCIDCWLRRTSPAMCSTFLDPGDPEQVEALARVLHDHVNSTYGPGFSAFEWSALSDFGKKRTRDLARVALSFLRDGDTR